ncbi:MAG TPA: putative Ig domain-containing protein [Bryobacteraceae bacterium]|nr:putative Ig domain-containing protein [Bryobacteraceae bacterium]
MHFNRVPGHWKALLLLFAAAIIPLLAQPSVTSVTAINPETNIPVGPAITAGSPFSGVEVDIGGTGFNSNLFTDVLWVDNTNPANNTTFTFTSENVSFSPVPTPHFSLFVPSNLYSAATTVTLTVEQTDGTSSGTLTINPPLTQADSLAVATAGSPYAQSLFSGGTSAYTVSLIAGSLPAGLPQFTNPTTLNVSTISGTPTTPEVYNFVLSITDAWSNSIDGVYVLTVAGTPTITSLSQASTTAGDPGPISLLVTGTNFLPEGDFTIPLGRAPALLAANARKVGGRAAGPTPTSPSTVLFTEGTVTTPLATNFQSDTALVATIPGTLLAVPGIAQITVLNPNGSVSNALQFVVVGPSISVNGLNPSSHTVGSPAFTLTVTGAGFLSIAGTVPVTSQIFFGATGLPTTFVNANTLQATVPANLIAAAGPVNVTVHNPGGSVSAASVFTVAPLPSISGFTPAAAVVGGPAFNLAVNGLNFTNTMTVLWNGSPLVTTFGSGTVLNAAVPANLIAASGTASITVRTSEGLTLGAANYQIARKLLITNTGLPNGATGKTYTFSLTGTGGIQPYSWSATGLPDGMIVDSATGAVGGTPTVAGNFTVQITLRDASQQTAQAQLPLTITQSIPQLEISTTMLPMGNVGVAYSAVVAASGGTPAYTFTVSSGSLPDGITLNASGGLQGKPTTAGRFPVTFEVTDSTQATAFGDLVIVIAPPPLTITNVSPLPNIPVNTSASIKFTATGGTPPYTFGVTGSLPPGTKLAADGTLSGTPVALGTFSFRVAVTDQTKTAVTKDFTLTVVPQSFGISTASPLQPGQVAVAYSVQFEAVAGQQPYTWSATGVPDGLTMSGTGLLTGTPTTSGTFTLAVTVTDKTGAQASGNFDLTIASGQLTITTTSLPNGIVGTNYSAALVAIGGSKPYTWTATGLPGGLTLASSGAITGKPTATGSSTVAATVTDSTGATAKQSFTLTVVQGALTITTQSIAGGTLGSSYSAKFDASGGKPPYTWSATGAPDGLTMSTDGTLSGTIKSAATGPFMVTVKDSANATASGSFQISVTTPAAPGVTVTGIPSPATPLTQPTLQVGVASAYPADINFVLTMTFSPDSGPDDPSVQFATGGRTAHVTVPAGATAGTDSVGVQLGTVAGTITITMQMLSGGKDITPAPAPQRTIRINAGAPVITSVTVTRSASGFSVSVVGFSTDRELTQAVFQFTGAAGSNLQTSSVTVPVDAIFATWYNSAASAPFGSQFTFTQPFNVQGDNQAIASVSVVLTNKMGSSASASAKLP